MDAFGFRSWRAGGVFLSLESRHRSSGRGCDHASSRRSLRRKPAVMANFHPRELWLSIDRPMGDFAAVVAQAERAGMKLSVKKEGDEFDYGGAHMRVLAPGRDQVTGSVRPNDDCLVFTARLAGRRRCWRGCGASGGAARGGGACGGNAAESGASWERERNVRRSAGDGSSPVCGDFGGGAECVWASAARGAGTVAGGGVKTYRTDEEGAVSFYLDGKSVTAEVGILH